MEWQDQGVVLGTRRHGETSVIVELMTPSRGRHLGLVRGGRSRRMRPVLQAGNLVEAVWRARLDEHLGNFQIEGTELRAARLFELPVGVFAVQTLSSHLRLLPERDPHRGLYDAMLVVLNHLEEPAIAGELMVRFEIALLEELGFGLDLNACAVNGTRGDLAYVSPKTGRAVSRAAAAPWAQRLLVLPPFLDREWPTENQLAGIEELAAGFRLCGHFLERHIYLPRGIAAPEERNGFINAIQRQIVGQNKPKNVED